MADGSSDSRFFRRVAGPARSITAVGVVLGGLLYGAAAPALAVETGAPSPSASTPQAITDYEPSTPAYAGAPWFEPGQPYDQNFPDPQVVRQGSTYWAYSTSTGGPTMPAMWSTDLVTWTARNAYKPNTYNSDPFFADAFPVPPTWSVGGAVVTPGKAQWAPSVTQIGGSWVAYTAWEITPGRRCISAARSSSPAGPFVDPSVTPLICDSGPAGSIDAAPFVDATGQPWLTWKAEAGDGLPARIYSQALASDGLSLKPGTSASLLLVSVFGWEGMVVENPSMLYSGGAYWLLYSAGDWESSSYRMGQARCAGPAGPCERTSSDPLMGDTATDLGPGGGSLFVDASGRVRLAYHAWNAPFTAYPSDPNCDAPGLCASEGQRFLHIDGVVAWAGRLTVDPVGVLDSVSSTGGAIGLAGWALDPSAPGPIAVHVYVDGRFASGVVAGGGRADIAAAFPGLGSAHGFGVSVPAAPGSHEVCAYGIDVGAGSNSLIGCRSVLVASGPPFGSLDVAVGRPGGVSVAGWAADPDTTAPIQVHVYVDGAGTALTAGEPRVDVAAALPGVGPNHGYSARLSADPGIHQVCAYAINVGVGSNSLVGCREVSVPGGPPIGNIDVAGGGFGGVALVGWAIDPDTTAPIQVHVYVDGVGVPTLADASRPDVGAFFTPYGDRHGFSVTVPAGGGPHTVCAYGINVGTGSNSLIGCRTVVVPDNSPFGSLDAVTPSVGAVFVDGWAIDPELTGPIDVHVYVDTTGTVLRADQARADVGVVYPAFGQVHGYGASVPAPAGTHDVCAYAINVGAGSNRLLGCRTITVR
jgi:hypothetical protein